MLIAHRSARVMAETLVGYMKDPREILRTIRGEFPDTGLTIRHIIELREVRNRRREAAARGPKVSRQNAGLRPDPLPGNVEAGSANLHKALWREHPRILRSLGAVPCRTK